MKQTRETRNWSCNRRSFCISWCLRSLTVTYKLANHGRPRGGLTSPLEIGRKNQNFIENMKSAAQFRLSDWILAMTVYLPVGHSHCIRARFTALVSCSSQGREAGARSGSQSRSPSKFGWPEPKIFRWWSRCRSLKFGFGFHRCIL